MQRTDRTIPAEEWWIVETEELGATACPSRTFAFQAAEVCSGSPNRLKVLKVRPALRGDPLDELAIKQSQEEIREVSMDALQKSGALNHTHRAVRDVGRVYLVPKVAAH